MGPHHMPLHETLPWSSNDRVHLMWDLGPHVLCKSASHPCPRRVHLSILQESQWGRGQGQETVVPKTQWRQTTVYFPVIGWTFVGLRQRIGFWGVWHGFYCWSGTGKEWDCVGLVQNTIGFVSWTFHKIRSSKNGSFTKFVGLKAGALQISEG